MPHVIRPALRRPMPQRHPLEGRTPLPDDAGFTLIELLVVIAILGLLIGLVAPAALRQLSGAKDKIAHQQIDRLEQVLDLYKLDMGAFPGQADGLHALVSKPVETMEGGAADDWNGPYVKGGNVPVDPWNHEFTYRIPSSRPNHDYDLCSRGPDVDSGDAAKPICNK